MLAFPYCLMRYRGGSRAGGNGTGYQDLMSRYRAMANRLAAQDISGWPRPSRLSMIVFAWNAVQNWRYGEPVTAIPCLAALIN